MTNFIDLRIGATTIPKQIPKFELEKIPCCYFLREKNTQNRLKLNEPSALIWEVSTGQWTVAEIIDVLKESYPESEQAIEGDVYKALEMLAANDAIELLATKS